MKYFASKCVCLMTLNTFSVPEISGSRGFPVPLISPDCIIMYFTHAEYMMHSSAGRCPSSLQCFFTCLKVVALQYRILFLKTNLYIVHVYSVSPPAGFWKNVTLVQMVKLLLDHSSASPFEFIHLQRHGRYGPVGQRGSGM